MGLCAFSCYFGDLNSVALHHDLLRQARILATHEPRRPKQASLRRAISAAYYSLFHLLTWEASARFIKGPNREPLRASLRRAFAHKMMKDACREIVKPNAGNLHRSLCGNPVPPDLLVVARTFVDLQQARHEADYDTSKGFTRRETLDQVEAAEQATARWNAIRKTIPADAFLAALLALNGMSR